MRVGVAWSGGIDSTFVLARLLKETDYKVLAHHIYIKNRESRHLEEMKSVKDLIPKLKKIRDFDYSENMRDDSRLKYPTWDMEIVNHEMGVVAKSEYLEGIATNDPEKELVWWCIGSHSKEGHWQERWDNIYPSFMAAKWSNNGRVPKTYFKLLPMEKKSFEIRYLDDLGLYNDTWHCRQPIYPLKKNDEGQFYKDYSEPGKECGNCKTCIEVRYSEVELLITEGSHETNHDSNHG